MEWLTEVITLVEGQSFGELALLNNAPRAATVQCVTDCLFAVINKNEYDKVLKKIDNKEISMKIDFFKDHLPFLNHWTITRVKEFIYSFHVRTF